MTGALHLDGLADTADALGGRTRERRLEIMRDSRIGTFGAAAVALDLLIKVGAMEQLVARGLLPALIAAGAVSRATSVLLAGWLPYARESGTGGVLGRPSRIALAVCLPAAPFALPLRVVFRRLFGGVTGDILGAAIEVTETLALVFAAALA